MSNKKYRKMITSNWAVVALLPQHMANPIRMRTFETESEARSSLAKLLRALRKDRALIRESGKEDLRIRSRLLGEGEGRAYWAESTFFPVFVLLKLDGTQKGPCSLVVNAFGGLAQVGLIAPPLVYHMLRGYIAIEEKYGVEAYTVRKRSRK